MWESVVMLHEVYFLHGFFCVEECFIGLCVGCSWGEKVLDVVGV